MTNLSNLKVNDVIIRFGQVYKVFKVEEKDGKDMVFYKKIFNNSKRAISIFSIPQSSVEKTKMRKALTKKEMDSLLGKELKEMEVDLEASLNTLKTVLHTDDPTEVVKTLKLITILKHKADKLPFSKKEVYGSLLKRLGSEVAYVYDTDQDEAKEIIEKALIKITKDIPKNEPK
jgi:RNA polymerase-interacting CarD/CdnL/TRCF family regulator